jgi:hypothetical protein
VTVANVEGPREARPLDVTGTAERDRGIGGLTGRRKEHFGIDALAYTTATPGQIVVAFLDGA